MLRRLFIMWAILAIALLVAALLVPDVTIEGGPFGVFGLALLYGLVNAVAGRALRLLTHRLTVLTLGLFALIVNAILLAVTAGFSHVLDVGGFLQTIVAALVISIVTTVLHKLLLPQKGEAHP